MRGEPVYEKSRHPVIIGVQKTAARMSLFVLDTDVFSLFQIE